MAALTYLERFSPSCTISLAPSGSESLPKGSGFELSDKSDGRKSGESRLSVLIGYLRSVAQISVTR